MNRFLVPAHFQRFELDIKRSRFITSIERAENAHQATAFVQRVASEMPDANHHCWATVSGNPADANAYRQNDDGEPKGTAGKPMLNVLQHSGLGHIAVVVTRYFGGIKLGAGGLVRAYSQSVSTALDALETQEYQVVTEATLCLPYSQLATSEHWLQDTSITVSSKEFTDVVTLCLHVPLSEVHELKTWVASLGHTQMTLVLQQ